MSEITLILNSTAIFLLSIAFVVETKDYRRRMVALHDAMLDFARLALTVSNELRDLKHKLNDVECKNNEIVTWVVGMQREINQLKKVELHE